MYADQIDLSITITSEITYYDDHIEEGPSTEFRTQWKDHAAFEAISRLYNRTISSLTRKPFGGWALWNIGQVLVPDHPESKKKYIIYFVHMDADIHWPDGTTENRTNDEEYKVPLYNDFIDWNLRIEE